MNPTGKKLISLFLVFSLMMLSVNLYAKERRGAKLQIIKTDGKQIAGELITVKPNSLLLLNTEGKDVSVSVEEILIIRHARKSKFLKGIGIGILIGAGGGAIFGFAQGETHDWLVGTLTAWDNALIGGALFGFLGLIVGAIAGAVTGKYKTIQIEGMTDSEIQKTLSKLRKKARIRDYK